MQTKQLLIQNKLGLHARAAAKLVNTAGRFAAEIKIKKHHEMVNAKSIMGVMMLAASKGTQLEFTAEGEDEIEALQAVEDLLNNKFGEGE